MCPAVLGPTLCKRWKTHVPIVASSAFGLLDSTHWQRMLWCIRHMRMCVAYCNHALYTYSQQTNVGVSHCNLYKTAKTKKNFLKTRHVESLLCFLFGFLFGSLFGFLFGSFWLFLALLARLALFDSFWLFFGSFGSFCLFLSLFGSFGSFGSFWLSLLLFNAHTVRIQERREDQRSK